MKINPKPCKGTRAETKGYGCGTMTVHRVYGLGKMCGCYSNWLLNSEAGKLKLKKATLKAAKPRLDLKKAEKEHKERSGITSLIKSTVKVFHEYVRERDKHLKCIACGTPWKLDFQASHFYKSEIYSSLKFNEYNVHAGCVECNIRKEGNLSEYQVNLPIRIGVKQFEELNRLAGLEKRNSFKWCAESIKNTRKYYRDKLKNLHENGK